MFPPASTARAGAPGPRLRLAACLIPVLAALLLPACDGTTDLNDDGFVDESELPAGVRITLRFICAVTTWPIPIGAAEDQCVAEVLDRRAPATARRVANVASRLHRSGKPLLGYQLRSQRHAVSGSVSAAAASPLVLELPVEFLAHPKLKRVFIEITTTLVDKKFKTPKKQFKSVEVKLHVDGKKIDSGTSEFDAAQGTASVVFEGLKLRRTDIVVATVTFTGGSVVNGHIVLRGTAAGE